jgi:hypothetical protein
VLVENGDERLLRVGHDVFQATDACDRAGIGVGGEAFEQIEAFGVPDECADVDVFRASRQTQAAAASASAGDHTALCEPLHDLHQVMRRDVVGGTHFLH